MSLSALALIGACTPSGPRSDGPAPAPTPTQAATVTTATISVSSVQMFEDCPDSAAEILADAELERGREAVPTTHEADEAKPQPPSDTDEKQSGDSFVAYCQPSTIQIALEASASAPVSIEIKAVRLLAKTKPVGTLQTRRPEIWTGSAYEPWDQTLAPGVATKVSYKLGHPDWTAVEQAIDANSYGFMFVLELDVLVDGEVQTVRSPEFPREAADMIET